MPKREHRPRDFFGPDDYVGGDPSSYIEDIQRAQKAWDERRAAMPWWLRLLTGKA